VDEEELPRVLELAEQRLDPFDQSGCGGAGAGEPVSALTVRKGAKASAGLPGHVQDSRVVRIHELVVAVDLHRRRERDERGVDAVPVEELEAPVEVVIAEVDTGGALDGKLEDALLESGRGGPARERREERFRPEVLVDVDCEQGA
jgi:hypothetical protein